MCKQQGPHGIFLRVNCVTCLLRDTDAASDQPTMILIYNVFINSENMKNKHEHVWFIGSS